MLLDRELMERMDDVLFIEARPIPYEYDDNGYCLLNYLLFDSNLDRDFPAFLAYQKKRMGCGTTKKMPEKVKGQRDIRGFFVKK